VSHSLRGIRHADAGPRGKSFPPSAAPVFALPTGYRGLSVPPARATTGQQHGKIHRRPCELRYRRAKLVLSNPPDEPQGFRRLPHGGVSLNCFEVIEIDKQERVGLFSRADIAATPQARMELPIVHQVHEASCVASLCNARVSSRSPKRSSKHGVIMFFV